MLTRHLFRSTAAFSPPDDAGAPDGGQPPPSSEVVNNQPAGSDGSTPPASDQQPAAEGQQEAAVDKKPAAVAPVKQRDWRDREIGRKHAQNQTLKSENERLQRQLADAQALLERNAGQSSKAADAP